MKISVIAPVFNEVDFIGYSLMAIKDHIHEVIYACADSTDGTNELLWHIKEKYYGDKLKLLHKTGDGPLEQNVYNFNPLDMTAYNKAFNECIAIATGNACWFLHPDMIVTNPEALDIVPPGPLAWWTNITSYAGDFKTVITEGRGTRWKNIHATQFGLHYYGGYGSQNEDFYHRDITGKSYKHYGNDFEEYPFEVSESGINVNHYCELKAYKRRLEKMKLCLRTQHPAMPDDKLDELAKVHPRVTLESMATPFGRFAFEKSENKLPDVFDKYQNEFESFKKDVALV